MASGHGRMVKERVREVVEDVVVPHEAQIREERYFDGNLPPPPHMGAAARIDGVRLQPPPSPLSTFCFVSPQPLRFNGLQDRPTIIGFLCGWQDLTHAER